MTDSQTNAKLDRMLGKVDAIMALQADHSRRLDLVSQRVAKVEQGVTATKGVVEAWTAAKTSLRFVKWTAGLIAAVAGMVAVFKGALQR